MGSLLVETRRLLAEYAITPKKSLGQSFVVDSNLVDCLIDNSDLGRSKVSVLEVGGGIGTLSQEIHSRSRALTIVEKDPLLGSILFRRFSGLDNPPSVIVGDFLQVPLEDTFSTAISNLPFYASTSITFRILTEFHACRLFVATYQKEYAARMCASPGEKDYGRLSLMLSYYGSYEIVKTFPSRSFWPPPKVTVSIVKYNRIDSQVPGEVGSPAFRDFVVALFGRKHRKVRGQLRNYFKHHYKDVSSTKLERTTRKLLGIIGENRRIISLTNTEVLFLFRTLQEDMTGG